MKIECPECKLTGNINDATVPATGLAMTCPRCKKHFTVEKNMADTTAMLDTCPSCQFATFSEEKFAVCPQCGLVVADYQQKLRESKATGAQRNAAPVRRTQETGRISEAQRQRDEESRKKYGVDKVSGDATIEEPAIGLPKVEAPLPVFIVGWTTVIVAVLLVLYGGSGINEYFGKVDEAAAALAVQEQAASPAALFFEFFLFPALSVVYALVMMVIALKYMSMQRWCVKAMQRGAWAGVALIALMKMTETYFWFDRASAGTSISYYAMGLVGDLLMAALCLAPFLALGEYFNSSLFEKIDDLFT